MTTKRGALLVLEGCDRAGKSTQVQKLVTELNARGISAEVRRFPDRTTEVGKIIDKYLSRVVDLPPETVHLLFSSNRWEKYTEMRKTILSGTTLVVDRYAASGAAYTAATTGKDLSWCKEPDRGLPKPDLVALLEISDDVQASRANWGSERFERSELQQKVRSSLHQLMDESWVTVDANDDIDKVHAKLLALALSAIEMVKGKPLGELYDSKPL
ncbi:thymidylate kinase [Neodiprion fabricii]|uniref:thymidylate kinase n=1 Tax=Neodiprion fabricii TaxID=2872261 RepID=UPI001ED8C45D|nr:thymidylate kinase [Neodiprion fabricii]